MADINGIAKAFVDYYYQTFDTNRANLGVLYRDMSMLTFEGSQFQGASKIVEKLVSLPFARVVHRVATVDAQPSSNGILIAVTGQLLIDEEQNPQHFSQLFHLIPENESSYWIFNDIFRLNYG